MRRPFRMLDPTTVAEAARELGRLGEQARIYAGGAELVLLLRQFATPITLILVFATVVSAVLGEVTDAAIILAIVLLSGLLSFWQEYGASRAVEDFTVSVRWLLDAVATGPPSVASEYRQRYHVPARRLIIAANDVDVAAWQRKAKVNAVGRNVPCDPRMIINDKRYAVLRGDGMEFERELFNFSG